MRKGCDKSTGPKSSPKCMFKRHSERNCRKKNTKNQPEEGLPFLGVQDSVEKRSFVKQSGSKSSRKCMFKRHSERNCQKKQKKQPEDTYKCLKACIIIVDLHYTLNYADCSKQIWKSAYYSCFKVGTSWGNKFKK